MYYQFQIHTQPELSEIILAYLQDLPFESYEETDNGWNAYVPADQYSVDFDVLLERLKEKISFEFQKNTIPDQNWNAVWESNFDPIIIDDFCGIRADFHAPIPQVEQEIIINPKMAFGTGHHETTDMVIRQMRTLAFNDAKVLDYGCGTGILAILASRLGAREVVGVEIERPAVENALENIKTNQVSNVKIIAGTLEQVREIGFDIILANINRNVILASLPALYSQLNQNGTLIVSGLMKQDRRMLLEQADQQGFIPINEREKNQWICIAFMKK